MKKLAVPFVVAVLFISAVGYFYKYGNKVENTQEGENIQSIIVEEEKVVKINGEEIKVMVSDMEETRNKGLGGVTSLRDDEGMLFVFEEKDIKPTFWMKGMEIPIDIIWINDEKIVQIDKNAQPEPGVSTKDLKLYPANQPIDFVLEVRANLTSDKNIKVGDKIDLSKAL